MTAISPLAARLGTATPDSADGSFTEDSDTAANSRQQTPSPVRNGFETPVTESPSTTVTASSFAPAGLAGLSTTVTYTGTSNVTADVGEDGVLHIRPIPTRKGRKIKVKKVVNFVPRISTFDRFHTAEQTQSFWGFYVLFWLMMSLVLLRMFYHSYLNSGVIVGLRFAKLISADGVTLALSDAALVGTTVLAVPFVQLMQHGWIRYHGLGVVIQHFGQAVLLATAIRWTFYREWYWVQSGYLTLHTLVMLMKTHSYIAYNGQLSESKRQLRKKTVELDRAVESAGGWKAVLSEASKLHASAIASPLLGSAELPEAGTALARPKTLSRRRRSSALGKDDDPPLSPLPPDDTGDMKDPRRLIDYPDEKIYNLANDCVDLLEDLTSTGKESIVWPANVTYTNYIDYLLIPTLVYELEYPRTSSVRPIYVLEKTLATFGTFFVLYAITEHIILPTHEAAKTNAIRNENFVLTALDLVLPFMINYLLIFYIIFECVCNGFAELTRFADRGFYEDWWNAVTWEEFARKWNKPVHQFLLRHVYASTIAAFRLSKFQASFLTFLLSAAIHELVMAIVSKKFRLYLFLMQMCQLPLIMAGRLPFMRKHPLAGNLFFWLGLVSGFPLLAIGYLRF